MADPVGERVRGRRASVRGLVHLGDEVHGQRLVGAEDAAGEQDVQGDRLADERPSRHSAAGGGDDAEVGLRLADREVGVAMRKSAA